MWQHNTSKQIAKLYMSNARDGTLDVEKERATKEGTSKQS
jgi:hypothetical protein